jgi:hypothetical protein
MVKTKIYSDSTLHAPSIPPSEKKKKDKWPPVVASPLKKNPDVLKEPKKRGRPKKSTQ